MFRSLFRNSRETYSDLVELRGIENLTLPAETAYILQRLLSLVSGRCSVVLRKLACVFRDGTFRAYDSLLWGHLWLRRL